MSSDLSVAFREIWVTHGAGRRLVAINVGQSWVVVNRYVLPTELYQGRSFRAAMPKIVCIKFDNYGYIFYAYSSLDLLDLVLDLGFP